MNFLYWTSLCGIHETTVHSHLCYRWLAGFKLCWHEILVDCCFNICRCFPSIGDWNANVVSMLAPIKPPVWMGADAFRDQFQLPLSVPLQGKKEFFASLLTNRFVQGEDRLAWKWIKAEQGKDLKRFFLQWKRNVVEDQTKEKVLAQDQEKKYKPINIRISVLSVKWTSLQDQANRCTLTLQ